MNALQALTAENETRVQELDTKILQAEETRKELEQLLEASQSKF